MWMLLLSALATAAKPEIVSAAIAPSATTEEDPVWPVLRIHTANSARQTA